MTPLIVIVVYLILLLGLGIASSRYSKGTSTDFFVASHSIGPFMLLMSIFGTTMTAFALVGSTGKAFSHGIGVYGMMASWSGLVHSAVFFLIGIRLWAIGKRNGYLTQCQYFRGRFDNDLIGYILFPVLVALVIPYLLLGLLGAGAVVQGVTGGMFPDIWPSANPRLSGAVPPWLTGLVISAVVLTYVFLGGVRGAVWANTFQTMVFMVTGVVAFVLIARMLGGLAEASRMVLEKRPELLTRQGQVGQLQFLTYLFVPLSVGMFPHLFQHWLTARSAKSFRLTIIAHPIFILIVWAPCILIGIWAAGSGLQAANPNAVLAIMVKKLNAPLLTGMLTAGILAAIMSSLDSQFMCLGTMFTNDIVLHGQRANRFTDRQKVLIGRIFIVCIVAATYWLSLQGVRKVFDLGVWCFSGFGSLFPLVFAAVYWKRTTAAGAIACITVTALVWFILFRMSGYGGEYLLWGAMPVVYMFAASVVSLVVVSLLTRPPPEETLQKFFIPKDS